MTAILIVLIAVFACIASYAKGRIDGHRTQILRGL